MECLNLTGYTRDELEQLAEALENIGRWTQAKQLREATEQWFREHPGKLYLSDY